MTSEGGGMSASNFRFVIGLIFVVIIAGLVAGYYFGSSLLTNQAEDLKDYLNSNSSTVNNSATVLKYKSILENNANLQTKIAELSTPVANYRDQVDTILKSYATKSGISIESLSYEAATASRVDARVVGVNIDGQVNYDNLVKFLTYIESTLPKINVSKLNLSVGSNTTPGNVIVDDLTLEVLVK